RYTTTVPYGVNANIAEASGTAPGVTTPVRADDINYHLGVIPGVSIVKAVDALDPLHPTTTEDANTQPAKELLVGQTAVWTYLVTNTGNATVQITGILDDNGTPTVGTGACITVYVSRATNGNGLLHPDDGCLLR